MGIRYYKLFDLLNRKGMKKSDLRAILSSSTVAKLSKGEYLSGEAIEKICLFLNCQPGDIMEVITESGSSESKDKITHINWLERDVHNIITVHETTEMQTEEGNEVVFDEVIEEHYPSDDEA